MKKTAQLLFLAVLLWTASAAYADGQFTKTDLNLQIDSKRNSHPNIEYKLYQLLQIYKTEGLSAAREVAERNGMEMDGDRIQILLITKSGTSEEHTEQIFRDLEQAVESLGGKIEARFKAFLQASVPLVNMKELLENRNLKYIRLPSKHLPDIISEGVAMTGADYWQNLKTYKSPETPLKVAIIDSGFIGYRNLLGTELPEHPTVISFRSDGLIETSAHGTAMAEIVYDMAPDAELYLLNYNTFAGLRNAVNYCIANGINIITRSISLFNAGAGDGTGPLQDIMRYAKNAGIIWTNSCGNYAQDHWDGKFRDSDNDGWHEFSDGDELLEFRGVNDGYYYIPLNWSDWGIWNGYDYPGTDQDFDLFLFLWNGTDWEIIDRSENVQNGSQWPTEAIWGHIPSDGTYALGIKRISGTKEVEVELFTYGRGVKDNEYYVSERSISIGADSPDILAVGAVYWDSDEITYYSSRGPTSDGRIKPDISAPSHVSCFSLPNYGCTGTSSATPHVAGAIALIRSKLPFYTFEDIKAILEGRAIDKDTPGKDNKYGIGRLYLR